MKYEEALGQLFRAPHANFVTERKRLAAEIKNGGDKDGAARLAKLGRPPISAWAVNQLWWNARAPFDEMLSTAKKVREGDLGAMQDHRAALAKLRERATEILTAAGNAAADATIRRIQMTLSAIAASGGFDPDPPGALTEDRDPPGFAALGIPSGPAVAPAIDEPPQTKKAHLKAVSDEAQGALKTKESDAKAATKARDAEEKARAAAEKLAATKARDAEEKAALKAKQAEEAAAEAAEAQTRKEEAQAEVDRLRAETERLEDALTTARADLKAAERHLAKLSSRP